MADIFDLSDTWNDSETTFAAIKIDVTDTSSAAGSRLLDLQVGSESQFQVAKDGAILAKDGDYRWKLGGREAVAAGVPYFRSEKTNSFTALDIIPNGTGGADATGKAWIHILNNDLGESASEAWEGLVLAASSDKMTIGSDHGSSGTLRDLHVGGSRIVFQDRGKSPSTTYGEISNLGFYVGSVGSYRTWISNSDIRLGSGMDFRWSATADIGGTLDTGLERSAAGVVRITAGTSGTYGTLLTKLPTSDPAVAGVLWNNAGTPAISAG